MQNQISISDLCPGDLVFRSVADFKLFQHYGCYAGRDRLGRHWIFEHGKGGNARLTSFEEFSKGKQIKFERILEKDSVATSQRMSELLKDPKQYDLLIFNCEHAARYVASGKKESPQAFLCVLIAIGAGFAMLSQK